MTLGDITTLTNKLAASLQSGGPSPSDRALADDYADVCNRINERLLQCARMIDEGSAMQALMLAEQKPNLMDAVKALSFAKSAAWREGCALNALRQAPKLDHNAVHKLNDLYNKADKSEQTKALYRKFREAIAKRDDAAALDTIRAIAGLDPADANAAEQVARLERKRREDLVNALGAAVAKGDDAAALSLLDQCPALGLTDGPEIAAAKSVRTRILAEEAKQEISEILPLLGDWQAQGRWQQCGERASRVKSLCATYSLGLSPSEASIVDAATAYFESCRKESMHKARFNEAVSALSDCTDRIQRNEQIASKKNLEALEEEHLDLKKCYERAKEFVLPVPDGLVARVGQAASALEIEIARLRRARKARNISLSAATALVLLAVTAVGYVAIRGGQLAGELRGLIAAGKSVAVAQHAAEIREKYAMFMTVPSLRSALFEADGWLENVSAQKTVAEAAIVRACSLAGSNFEQTTPTEADAVFRQAQTEIDKLPADTADTLRPKLSESDGKLQIWLAAKRDESVTEAKAKIEEARQLSANVDAAVDIDALRSSLEPFAAAATKLVAIADSQVERLGLPAGMKAEIADLAAKSERTADLVRSYEAAAAGLAASTTLEEYGNALEKLSQVQLPRSPAVKAAHHMLTKKLDTHHILGAVMLPGAPGIWASTKNAADFDALPQPKQTRDTEKDILGQLVNEENLVNIHEATIQESVNSVSSAARKIYSRGRLDITSDRIFGVVYEPSRSGAAVDFKEKAYLRYAQPRTDVREQKESDVSKAMRDCGIDRSVNSDGSRYEKSLLEVMDNVAGSRSMPALAKAYVLQQLSKVVQLRSPEWGLAWVPTLDSDLAEIKQLAGGTIESGDWMVPAKAQAGQRLADWFKKREGMSYQTQQRVNRMLAKSALEAGLLVCGYADEQGRLVETQRDGAAGAAELWGFDVLGGNPTVMFAKSESSFVPKGTPLPFTPLFKLPWQPDQVLQQAFNAASVAQGARTLYLAGVPPIFSPRSVEPAGSPQ